MEVRPDFVTVESMVNSIFAYFQTTLDAEEVAVKVVDLGFSEHHSQEEKETTIID